MKKLMMGFLVVALIVPMVFVMSGCGRGNGENNNNQNNNNNNQQPAIQNLEWWANAINNPANIKLESTFVGAGMLSQTMEVNGNVSRMVNTGSDMTSYQYRKLSDDLITEAISSNGITWGITTMDATHPNFTQNNQSLFQSNIGMFLGDLFNPNDFNVPNITEISRVYKADELSFTQHGTLITYTNLVVTITRDNLTFATNSQSTPHIPGFPISTISVFTLGTSTLTIPQYVLDSVYNNQQQTIQNGTFRFSHGYLTRTTDTGNINIDNLPVGIIERQNFIDLFVDGAVEYVTINDDQLGIRMFSGFEFNVPFVLQGEKIMLNTSGALTHNGMFYRNGNIMSNWTLWEEDDDIMYMVYTRQPA